MNCEACGADNAPAARFCLNCGAGLSARCCKCAAELPPGARFCPACGQAIATAGPPESSQPAQVPAPERKQVTVLFADFSGFTSFSSKLDAEDVRDHMVSLWGRLDEVITSHGGTIEKHIGDAI